MFTSRLIASKVGYGLACFVAAVTLAVSGYAHAVVGYIDGTGKGIAIDGGPVTGAMNILVMGLESRTNFYGQPLSAQQLTETHSGNVQSVEDGEVGAQDTDTLILVHIFAGGQKAVGFSIPRDDLVTYPHSTYLGITEGKIDQAYDYAYNESLQQTVDTSMSQNQRYLEANQAGQLFEIQTVEAVTGVTINHFVEMNLIGFFELAEVFQGIEVCVKPAPAQSDGLPAGANLYDSASGWNAVADGYNLKKGGAQYLHLAADQALAFVRARDTIPGVDLGRTKRQQAVIDYVVWKLKNEGAFTDFALLNSLLSAADQYIITDSTFDPLGFATDMRALTGKNVTFYTLPIANQVNDMELDGFEQDVNIIDVPYIQQIVHNAFYPPPPVKKTKAKASTEKAVPIPPASTVTVDVYNGSGTPGLAGDTSQALVALGYQAGAVANADDQSQTVDPGTQVFYGAGASANAAKIATEAGTTGPAQALTSLPAGHVEVLLGSTVTAVPAGLTSSGSASASASATPSPTSAAAGNDGETGGAVTVAANAKFGIPCVY